LRILSIKHLLGLEVKAGKCSLRFMEQEKYSQVKKNRISETSGYIVFFSAEKSLIGLLQRRDLRKLLSISYTSRGPTPARV
jgi:hypothetical protein